MPVGELKGAPVIVCGTKQSKDDTCADQCNKNKIAFLFS